MVYDELSYEEEWTTNQTKSNPCLLPDDGILRGIGSKEITLQYTGSANNAVLTVSPNATDGTDWLSTATIENLIIDGQNVSNTTGILLKDVYNCQIRNLTIKNCTTGIMLTATNTGGSQHFSECNRIEHVTMINVDKGIVFERGSGTGSFAFTMIENVGISLKDNSNSTGITVGCGNPSFPKGSHPYNSIIRANVTMGPTNPGSGMIIDTYDGNPTYYGELRGGLANLNVINTGGSIDGCGINLNGTDGSVTSNNANAFFACQNVSATVNIGSNNEVTGETF